MGTVHKTLVLSDVSSSMTGLPMQVSIAMGLMVSQLASDAYKNLVLTFESEPRFHDVVGDSLFERVRSLENAPWGGSTDFAAAFRCILSLAKEHNLAAADMPERLVVVSDMQFNVASGYNSEKTNFEALKAEFQAAGYDLPHLVFWNVNGSIKDVPTESGEANVSLVSGFSTAILKCVLAGKLLTPLQTVLNVVLDSRYDAITLPPNVASDGSLEEDDLEMVVL